MSAEKDIFKHFSNLFPMGEKMVVKMKNINNKDFQNNYLLLSKFEIINIFETLYILFCLLKKAYLIFFYALKLSLIRDINILFYITWILLDDKYFIERMLDLPKFYYLANLLDHIYQTYRIPGKTNKQTFREGACIPKKGLLFCVRISKTLRNDKPQRYIFFLIWFHLEAIFSLL